MAVVNSFLTWMVKQRMREIGMFLRYPHEVQLDWFRRLIHTARYTEWGKRFEYNSIDRPDTFRERVPINDYESIMPFVDRLRKGERNILWPGTVKWFAKSSGTTGDRSKYIPVTVEALNDCHYRGGRDLLAIYCHNRPDSRLFDGRGISMGGSYIVRKTGPASFVYEGDLSAIIIRHVPLWVELRRTPGLSVALMSEWESKIGRMAEVTSRHRVTSASGVPSWTLLLFKKVLEITGKSNIMEVWPEFELFMHGGVSFHPYRRQFHAILPSPEVHYLETYNASEGFFSIQDQDGKEEMLLMLDYGIFYEFLPLDQVGAADPKTKLLHEVELNQNYAIVISTNAGLWRYMIGDTIQFTSLNPYRIKITGRTKNFINAFGEELIIDNAEKALAIACGQTKSVVSEYTVAPVYLEGERKGTHEWLIEFVTPPQDLAQFTLLLDQALKSVNSDYEAKRYHDLILREPLIRSMPTETFYKWLKSKGKLGAQYKVPRLSNDRKIVEEILCLEQKEERG
ncbi:MAG TPA: GH3 auxin-responsive promoter family protein [Bacteroidales bacterium]|nr:GH3 auxin-responsive promoter family protein [Bacteroidales bacterium]